MTAASSYDGSVAPRVPCHPPSYWEMPEAGAGWKEGGRSWVNRQLPGAAVTLRMLHRAGRSASQAGRSWQACLLRLTQCPNVNSGELLGSCSGGRAPDPRRAYAGDRLPGVGRGRPPGPGAPPAPVREAAGGQSGRAGGGRQPRPFDDAPTFLPEERRRPEGAGRPGATPKRHRRDIFFPFDTSDFFT